MSYKFLFSLFNKKNIFRFEIMIVETIKKKVEENKNT